MVNFPMLSVAAVRIVASDCFTTTETDATGLPVWALVTIPNSFPANKGVGEVVRIARKRKEKLRGFLPKCIFYRARLMK